MGRKASCAKAWCTLCWGLRRFNEDRYIQNAYEVIGGAQLSVNWIKYPQLSPAAAHVGHPWRLRRQGRLEVRAKNPKPRT